MLDRLDQYNVVWDSPSRDASGSMPIGNGDVAANVWVEQSTGDLLLLIAKSDAWDENSINLKLGGVRIAMLPGPPGTGAPFSQTLDLRTATIILSAGSLRLRIWIDAKHPVIRIEADSDEPFTLRATLEVWRTELRTIKTQTGDLFKNLTGPDPYPTIISPDRILPSEPGRIVWCHHNEPREHDAYEINMRLQGLGDLLAKMPHPLLGRTFGAAIVGNGLFSDGDRTLRSRAPLRRLRVSIHALTVHPSTVEQWRRSLDEQIAGVDRLDDTTTRAAHEAWWVEFWNRSWIYLSSDEPEKKQATFNVTQSYILQRFMNACAGRGAGPIKHNGSLFSVGNPGDPDFRRWGGAGFWFMNQRLIYWPMLAAGDFDLMLPWLRMYRASLPLQQHRTRTYFDHDGAHYPETITFWGAEISAHYGWTPFEERARSEAECPYVTYYWSGGIELALILYAHWQYVADDDFAREYLLPIADAVSTFYDLHYQRDAAGGIRFEPAQALETWHDATNPTPEIAGLRYLLPKLLELPTHLTTPDQRTHWQRMLAELPPLAVDERDGRRVVLPAQRFDKKKNTENPELYCVFPYRLFGVGKPDLQLARDTFAARLHASHECWSQDDVQMALLGLTREAKDFVTRRAAPEQHSDSRFPGFWNAHKDWLPDLDHGGVLQLALQFMLMQCEGRSIHLLPAWPRPWDADFKLHAPGRTIVEVRVRDGVVTGLRVTPVERRKDVVPIEQPPP